MGKGLYKKEMVPVIAMLMAAMMAGTVYAEEPATDEYGNTIDWEQGYGNEDGAGLENVETPAEQETYSFGEQADVLGEMAAAETTTPEETGHISISLGDMPSDWSQNNIRVTLYRGNAKEDIYLYRQSDWHADEDIPAGHYTFYKATTVDGKEVFHTDTGSFDISANTGAVLTLSYGESDVTGPAISVSDLQEIQDSTEQPMQQVREVTQKYIGIAAAVVGALVGALGIGIALHIRNLKKDKNMESDKSMLD